LADAADQVSMQNLHDRVPIASTADEVARLTLAFNSLLERLELSFTRIKRFTADASHEFRRPLTLMKCEGEDALRDPEAITQASTFERVLQEINRLNRICDSLLFLAGADSGNNQTRFFKDRSFLAVPRNCRGYSHDRRAEVDRLYSRCSIICVPELRRSFDPSLPPQSAGQRP